MRTTQSGLRFSVAAALLLLGTTGCRSAEQKALDQAKQNVTSTGQPEEVVATDNGGNTHLTLVQPPAQGTSTPLITAETIPSGSNAPGNIPDWSNGTRPAKGEAAIYRAPGMVVDGNSAPVATTAAPGTVAPGYAAPGAAANGNVAQGYPANTAPGTVPPNTGQPNTAPGGYANGPADQAPANFVPTDVTIPAGTDLAIRINQDISVKRAYPGEGFTGELAESISRDGRVILPRGTRFRGVVDAAHHRGRFKGRSILELRLTRLLYNGREYPIETADFVRSKKGKGKRTAGFIGGLGAAGALIGGLAGGGAGAVIGGVSGAGAGTGVAAFTGNRDINLPAESLVRFRLRDNLTVQPAQ